MPPGNYEAVFLDRDELKLSYTTDNCTTMTERWEDSLYSSSSWFSTAAFTKAHFRTLAKLTRLIIRTQTSNNYSTVVEKLQLMKCNATRKLPRSRVPWPSETSWNCLSYTTDNCTTMAERWEVSFYSSSSKGVLHFRTLVAKLRGLIIRTQASNNYSTVVEKLQLIKDSRWGFIW